VSLDIEGMLQRVQQVSAKFNSNTEKAEAEKRETEERFISIQTNLMSELDRKVETIGKDLQVELMDTEHGDWSEILAQKVSKEYNLEKIVKVTQNAHSIVDKLIK